MKPKKRAQKRSFAESTKKEQSTDDPSKEIPQQVGFAPHLQPEKILDAICHQGQLAMFEMKWKDTDVVSRVTAKEAKERWPQIVIKFYEEHLVWGTDTDDKSVVGPDEKPEAKTVVGPGEKSEKSGEEDDELEIAGIDG